jgi:hypothetical protein
MSDEEAVPVCVDCRFYRDPNTCLHPKASARNVVFGTAVCHVERYPKHPCGPDGRLFEASLPLPSWKRYIKDQLKL